MGLYLAAVLVPIQIFFGHAERRLRARLSTGQVRRHRRSLHDEQPASEVLLAIPDPASETNKYAISVPVLEV